MELNHHPIAPSRVREHTSQAVAIIMGAAGLAGYERRRWAAHDTAQAERANARPGQASMPPKADQGEGR